MKKKQNFDFEEAEKKLDEIEEELIDLEKAMLILNRSSSAFYKCRIKVGVKLVPKRGKNWILKSDLRKMIENWPPLGRMTK